MLVTLQKAFSSVSLTCDLLYVFRPGEVVTNCYPQVLCMKNFLNFIVLNFILTYNWLFSVDYSEELTL